MFIAKFNQVSAESTKFSKDKHGNLPFIGTVIAGETHTSIINGTIFEREKLIENQFYMCDEKFDPEYNNYSVVVLAPVSPMEAIQSLALLGKPRVIATPKAVETTEKSETQPTKVLSGNAEALLD